MALFVTVCVAAFLAHAEGGAVPYVRWGRKDCPRGNKLVYRGYAAGTHYVHKAGPANTLCLPEEPEYGLHTVSAHNRGYIYGTEYETRKQLEYGPLHNHDVPCAVCRARRNTVMIPARRSCPKGLRLQYTGYLMGGHYNYAASDFICVDAKAEAVKGGHENKNGHLLYLVEGVCGALPCPPYRHLWELTCVVCES